MRALPYIFGVGLVLTSIFLLMPSYIVPRAFNFWDKAQHGLVFTSLALTGLLAYPKRLSTVVCGLIFYGGLMEILQNTLTTTRHGDLVDWGADILGVVLGLGVYLLSKKYRSKA